MDKNTFNDKVAHPDQFTAQERGWLRAVSAKHPYSQVVQVMTLLADHAYGFDTPQQRRLTALSMCNPQGLTARMESVKAVSAEQPSFDVLNEINTFQEVSFKTAPKSVILSNFLKIATSDGQEMDNEEALPAESKDKKSLKADASLGTETLAIILEKQGKLAQAIAIYENLMERNPEKSSTFAARIEALKEQLNNKKQETKQ